MNHTDELNQFNEKLVYVRNYNQLMQLIKEAKEHDYELHMKRRRLLAFGFTQAPNQKKVRYLIDDTISVGLCRYDNLHRYMEFVF
jgi:hypothetical protein